MKSRLNRRTFLIGGAAGIAGLGAAANARRAQAAVASPALGTAVWDRLPEVAKQVPRNQTLIISVSDTENQIGDVALENPFVTGAYRTGWHFAFEPLFFYNTWHTNSVSGPSWNPGKNGEIPYQATGYQYKSDYSGVTIKLRQGVEWSDGQPFTSKDVAFTFAMLKSHAPTLTWSPQISQWVQDVATPDDHTVEITFTKPNPRFMLSYIMWHADVGFPVVPEHIWSGQNPQTFTNNDISKGWPVVTGPWKLVDASTNQKVWARRDDWWGAKAKFHTLPQVKQVVVLPLFTGPKLSELLINNDVDATHNLVPTDAQISTEKNPKLLVRSKSNKKGEWGWLDYDVDQVVFNDSTEPWSDPRMRWAVNHAIDRKQIVQVGFINQTQPTTLPFSSYTPLLPYFANAAPILKKYPVDEHNLKKSADLLKELGYTKDSSGFWAKGGTQLSMVIIAAAGLFDSYLPVLVAQLRKAGINASYKTPSNAGTLGNEGEFDALVNFTSGNSVHDPYDAIENFHSRYYAKTGTSATYPYRWKNSTYDEMIDKMAVLEAPTQAFTTAYHKAMEQWIPELPSIPLVRRYIILPVNTKYWTGWPDMNHPYTAPAMWHRGEAGLVLNTLKPAKPSS